MVSHLSLKETITLSLANNYDIALQKLTYQAVETDIEGNEGVYGLQRAFKIAGAKNLIMSLWTVPDEQTQEMMVLFYEYWLEKGMELREAFRAAQKAMREQYPEHYYWAAFVLIE